MQEIRSAANLEKLTEPVLAPVVAALQLASDVTKQAGEGADASAEELSRRISTLEISSRDRAEHTDLTFAMRKQIDYLLQKKARTHSLGFQASIKRIRKPIRFNVLLASMRKDHMILCASLRFPNQH